MKKSIVISLWLVLMAASVLGILGTQLFSGGRNPVNLVMFVLMMLIGGSAETIAFSVFKNKVLQILLLAATIGLAAWGMYLFLTSESWASATVIGLICGYCSPMIGGITSFFLKIVPVK